MDTSKAMNNHPIMIPNMNEPSKPLIVVTIPNPIMLTSTNYLSWKTQVEAILIAHNLHQHVDGTFLAPPTTITKGTTVIPNPAYQTWFRQDKLIFGALIGTLSSNLVHLVSQATTTCELWDILAKTYNHKPITTTQGKQINSVCSTTHQVIDLTSPPSSPVIGAKATTRSISLCNTKRRRKNKFNEGNHMSDQVDLISQLPDDILVHMLSFVELKTAGRTSLLSKRWRHVWTHRDDLDFEDSEYYSQGRSRPNDSGVERFLKWVNKVTTVNRASHLISFRIHSPLNGSHGGDINRWIKFALSKNVGSLELDFANLSGYTSGRFNTYKIERDFLLIRPIYTDNKHLSCLKSLHLEGLAMDGPSSVENVLAYCLNLERLTVKNCMFNSRCLRTMRVSRLRHRFVISSLKLKHLEMCLCCTTESLEISAPKLTTLILFAGRKTAVNYTSVPSLVDVTFGGDYIYSVYNDFNLISHFSFQLQKLSIYWNRMTCAEDSPLFFISFIEAIPSLHTFKLELSISANEGIPMSQVKNSKINYTMHEQHQHLKVLEIVGFEASASVAKFVICVTQNAPMVDKVICDPHSPGRITKLNKLLDIENADSIDRARSQVKLLAKHIRRGIDLVIL